VKPNLLIISNYSDPVAPIRPEAEIILRLKEQGFNIVIISHGAGTYPQKFREAGCPLIDHQPKSKFDHTMIGHIRWAVKEYNIDIIHAFNSKAIANAAWAVWKNKKVKLVSYRGYTGNIHWYDPTLYISFLNPRIDRMVCLAESVREMYIRNGVRPDRAVTINKGHDPSWYQGIEAADLKEFQLEDDTTVVALVANNRTRMKGILYVVEAASMLPADAKIKFLMIGNDLRTSPVDEAIKKWTVEDRFVFTGFRKDAGALVKAADISLSASLFGEATQKAVIEAMSLGNPMVITDISGNRGMVEDGRSGFVVPTKNASAIAEAVMKLHVAPALRTAMGQAAQRHIAAFLSIERSVKEYSAFYSRIASE